MKAVIRGQHLEVSVTDEDGNDLNEYKEEINSGSLQKGDGMSCYIECHEGQVFSVSARVPQPVQRLRPCEWILGFFVNGQLIREIIMDRKATEVWCSSMVHKERGHVLDSALQFTKLPTSNKAGEVSIDAIAMKELGQIKVEFWAGRLGAKSGRRDELIGKSLEPGVADERKAKHMTGTVGMGASKPHKPSVTYHFTRFDKHIPDYRFVFYYRTRAVLQLMKIIGGNEVDTVCSDDEEALGRLGVKRKRGGADLTSSRKVQRQGGEADSRDEEINLLRRQVGNMQNQLRELNKAISNGPKIDIIDLTADSDDELQ